MNSKCAFGMGAALLTSMSSAYTWIGPLNPPDGGVTLVQAGEVASVGGLNYTFSNLNTTQYTMLMWTAVHDTIKMNLSYQGSYVANDALTWDGIVGGGLRWAGHSNMVYDVLGTPTNMACETRFTVTPVFGCAAVDGGDYDLGAFGGLAKVNTGANTSFSVNILAEARPQTGGAWLPARAFYNQFAHPQGYSLGVAFLGGFMESMDRFYSGRIIDPTYKGTDLGLSKITFTCDVETAAGVKVATFTFKPEDDGQFVAHDSTPFLTGDYYLYLKGPHWLRKKIGPIALKTETNSGLDFNLINGDIDDTNYVGTDDYLVLNGAFDTSKGDPGFVVNADLDGDGYIGTDDYLIMNGSFDTNGD